MFKYQWMHFCRNTSLHGWKFTVLHKTTKWERLTWVIICLTALTVAISSVLMAWFEFQLNPTVTVTESTQYPIYKFAFPSVTICSLNGISKRLAYKMSISLKGTHNITVELLAKRMTLLFQLANNDNQNVPKEYYTELENIFEENKKTSEEVYRFISPVCSNLIKKCIWKGKHINCDGIFETIKTSIGYCCSFNYFAPKNHTFSRTFPKMSPKTPRRVSACGYLSALEVLLNNEPSDYFATHIPSIGYRVLIHDPYEFPDWAVQNILCEINTSNFIGINPTTITASDYIRKWPISQRKCLFSDERDLENFEVYNFHNCMVECRMHVAFEHCSCVPFYHHHIKGLENYNKICTLNDIPCLAKYEHLWYNETYLNKFNIQNNEQCNCLPDCEGTFYIPEASNGILDNTYATNQFTIHSEVPLENHTLLRIFFNDLIGTRHRKDSVFTWHTLMGYYGGIMGLFTGFSFISVVEILYFTTIRLTHHH